VVIEEALEVGQLEQKLRKKEEQLKIKEAILNENTNDRTWLLDRLYQAETKYLELEQTVLIEMELSV
jgi:hypothetical protein